MAVVSAAPVVPATPQPYPKTPVIAMDRALLCLVINVFAPGLGTIVSGVIGDRPLIGRGIAQFLLTFALLAGWIWAIVTGFQLVQNAKWAENRAARTG